MQGKRGPIVVSIQIRIIADSTLLMFRPFLFLFERNLSRKRRQQGLSGDEWERKKLVNEWRERSIRTRKEPFLDLLHTLHIHFETLQRKVVRMIRK